VTYVCPEYSVLYERIIFAYFEFDSVLLPLNLFGQLSFTRKHGSVSAIEPVLFFR
jgi:hypothetical protein